MRRMRRTAAILAGIALLGAACGGGDDKESSSGSEGTGKSGGDPITIGAVFDLSGATADVGTPYAEGIKGYVDFLNKKGGLEGRQINLLSQDYAYKVDQAEQLYSQFSGQGAVAIIGWGTADTEALRGSVNSDMKPFVSASFSENLSDPAETPFNFFPGASYSDQMRIALKWISEQEGGKETQVAVFHSDSPFGKSPIDDGKAYIDEKKLKIGYQSYPMAAGVPDFIGELGRAKSQGAKYIVIQNVPSPAAKLLANIKAQGMGVQVICLNYCGDELLVKLAGDAAEGAVGVMPFGPAAAATAGLDEINEHLSSTGKTLDSFFPPLRYVQGWYTAKVFLTGIGKAAAEADGAKLEGEAMKEGLESVKDFETGVGPSITWTADHHAGMDGAPLYKVEGGVWKKLTDVLTP